MMYNYLDAGALCCKYLIGKSILWKWFVEFLILLSKHSDGLMVAEDPSTTQTTIKGMPWLRVCNTCFRFREVRKKWCQQHSSIYIIHVPHT